MRPFLLMRVLVTGMIGVTGAAVIVIVVRCRARVSQVRTKGLDQVFQPCSRHGGALVFDPDPAGGGYLGLQYPWDLTQTFRKEPCTA